MLRPIFLGGFEDEQDLISEFSLEASLLERVHIIFADYDLQDEEGEAFVLFEDRGTLYEIHAFYCECDGLEGQWLPEECDYGTLSFRLQRSDVLKDHREEILENLKKVKISWE